MIYRPNPVCDFCHEKFRWYLNAGKASQVVEEMTHHEKSIVCKSCSLKIKEVAQRLGLGTIQEE